MKIKIWPGRFLLDGFRYKIRKHLQVTEVSKLKPYSFPFKAMGSPCELKIYSHSKTKAEKIIQVVINEVARFEEKYSRYKSTSVTSKINGSAGQSRPVEVDHETARLLDYADILYHQSDGLFDITSGILRQAWDFKSNQLPAPEKLKPLLNIIGWPNVIWENNTIQLPKKGMEIDMGGFVKEYATDVVANLCLENGVEHGFVNLGGDIKVIGPHLDDSPWRVGIQHPRKSGQPIAVIDVKQGGVATSGDYERYMMINGIRYCHLLNPITGQSIQPKYASISVVAESCLIAGSFTTIAMLKSEEDEQWIDDVGLPFLKVQRSMQVVGTL